MIFQNSEKTRKMYSVLFVSLLLSRLALLCQTVDSSSFDKVEVSESNSVMVLRNALLQLSIASPDQLSDVHSRIVDASFAVVEQSLLEDSTLSKFYQEALISAYVYLSTAQDIEMKYWLLHKATYMLYLIPGLYTRLKEGKWPVSARLLNTLYMNSERQSKLKSFLPVFSSSSILMYNFYMQDFCQCSSRSWCLPYWLAIHYAMDVFVIPRGDAIKPVYWYNTTSGCFESTGINMSSFLIENIFNYTFILDINSFMDVQMRTIQSEKFFLYPAYWLNEGQVLNFAQLGVEVIRDDSIMKPPNPLFRATLVNSISEEIVDRLIYLAEVRPLKGQYEFLQTLPNGFAVNVVLVGDCVGDQTYCDNVQSEINRLRPYVVWIGKQDDTVIARLLGSSLGLLHAPITDCNPRVVYEALWANRPFLVNEATRVPKEILHLGMIHKEESGWPMSIASFVEAARGGKWKDNSNFAKEFITDDSVYFKLMKLLKVCPRLKIFFFIF